MTQLTFEPKAKPEAEPETELDVEFEEEEESDVKWITDQSKDSEIAQAVMESLDAEGYTSEESLGGLALAILLLAERTPNADQALDEVVCIIDDGLDNA